MRYYIFGVKLYFEVFIWALLSSLEVIIEFLGLTKDEFTGGVLVIWLNCLFLVLEGFKSSEFSDSYDLEGPVLGKRLFFGAA